MIEGKGRTMKPIRPKTLNPIEGVRDMRVIELGGLHLLNIRQNNQLSKQRLSSKKEPWYKCICKCCPCSIMALFVVVYVRDFLPLRILCSTSKIDAFTLST